MRRLILFLILATILVSGCGHGIRYSEGERAGYVLKFSNVGFLCPTWEGTMNLGGAGQNSLVEFSFTVDSDKTAVIKFLQDAIRTGKRVEVSYHDNALVGPCTGKSTYFIQSAKYTE